MASKDFEWAKHEGKVHYSNYLQLDQIIKAQKTTSEIHDEHLFVVIHQVYELWFKQLRCEIDSICKEFTKGKDTNFLTIVTRLDRIIKILKLLVEQVRILETMSPQDFLEFRDNLAPASGFQSFQFRIMEYRIGFNEKRRTEFNNDKEGYKGVMSKEELEEMREEEKKDSLFVCIQRWLESLPELAGFPEKYERAIKKMIEKKQSNIQKDDDKEEKMKKLEAERQWYDSLIKKDVHDKRDDRRFNQKAFFGALMIYLYRDEPQFYVPYQILNQLIEMDTLLMKWRYSHMFLVQYQIGNRGGTGGTSGVNYLQNTIRNDPMFFPDLINMTSFFILKEDVPEL